MDILDVGCGNNKIKGSIGIDKIKTECTDIIHDISKGIPFPDKSFDLVNMNSILEHLQDTIFIMEEVYRVLRNNGIVRIEVPHYTSRCAYMDITHCKLFSIMSMNYFRNEDRYNYYSKAHFEIIKRRLKIYGSLNFFERLLNLNLVLSERFLLKILPIDTNIYWELKKSTALH